MGANVLSRQENKYWQTEYNKFNVTKENESYSIIVISVPHATCPWYAPTGGPYHDCDIVSDKAAYGIQQQIQNISNMYGIHLKAKLFIGNLPRTICDLNRKECRQSSFRRALTD